MAVKTITLDNDILWIRLVITTCDNQPDGKGSLRMDNGMKLLPNDRYPLDREVFRLYYTSESSDQQSIDLYFEDNADRVVQLTFDFNNENKDDEETAPEEKVLDK